MTAFRRQELKRLLIWRNNQWQAAGDFKTWDELHGFREAHHDNKKWKAEKVKSERLLEVDLHGYHPRTVDESGLLAKIIKQAWEMGAKELVIIHGHGMSRAKRRPFANTNTGVFGLSVRSYLRNTKKLRRWMFAKIDTHHDGSTTIKIRSNPNPTRTEMDRSIFPELDFRR
jgi:DNA-nicking Smr family endonuclease